MKAGLFLMAAFTAIFCLTQALHAEPQTRAPHAEQGRAPHAEHMAPHPEPRAKGIPQHGAFHRVVPAGGKPIRAQVFYDHRSHVEVRRDPHVVVFNHIGWRPQHHWDHWYRDWGVFWRFNDWNEVQTVTCEAVDTQTEQLFPVTESRGDWGWSSDLVNNVAARALDECAAETGQPENCVLIERECWNSVY